MTSTLSNPPSIVEATASRASGLLRAALELRTRKESAEAQKLSRLMGDAPGKAFTFAMVDEVFRSSDPTTQAARWRGLLSEFGVPHYPAAIDRALIRIGATGSRLVPWLVMPVVAQRLRGETAHVILDGEPRHLNAYLERRVEDGFRINLNQLGEAVLGEEEAEHRMQTVIAHLLNPRVTYISVKISAIFSQIQLVAWDDTLTEIKARLRRIYRAALPVSKFVNLDMEEYRDLALTMAAFREVLDEPEFAALSAGIVLQAYLPDSWQALQDLTAWARERREHGGAEIKIRLVKGANIAMESVEAELHGWLPAPYATKVETDANFRRMLEFACQPENAAAVRIGVASHNLFDVALAMELRERFGTAERIELEMLEGMANHQARAVRDSADGLLLYAPVVHRDDFLSAMAYLVRRLDENTAPQNFLRTTFSLEPGSPEWMVEQQRFEQGWDLRTEVGEISRRIHPAINAGSSPHFENEPDSDWTQRPTRAALRSAIADWAATPLPPVQPLDTVLNAALAAQSAWATRGPSERAEILQEAARIMATQRMQALACMRIDGRKAPSEGDPEVSEAIDFARYYATSYQVPDGIRASALGVVVVAPPWNFPYAIPCGGVLAALMAGNSVVLKPAPETAHTAWLLARQLWAAGVPSDVLHFFPCADGETGRALITDPRVSCVVLTGAIETARMFQGWRPSLRLLAETSGKNALLITAQADRELAIKDLVKSAFGHSGQKCSAASIAIVEAEVYDDPVFRRQLRDAASSLHVGAATDSRSIVTPLIRAPGEALRRALTQLDPGEEWLLAPRCIDGDPCLWSPGIRLGIQPGSWFHRTECFGPVLGVMCAESLDQAIEWQNATAYGLTAGLHSLDPAEQHLWRDRVQAGNLYVNRAITGAIVQRQPFGGWKRSSIGPGAKAGGQNYVLSFAYFADKSEKSFAEVEADYRAAWNNHFSKEHDPSALRCESNVFRYRPSRGVVLRLQHSNNQIVQRARLASAITGVPLTISLAIDESDQDFAARLPELASHAEFLRSTDTLSDQILAAAHDAGFNLIDAPLTACGRLELRHWLREQSISRTLHRYGQIPEWLPPSRQLR